MNFLRQSFQKLSYYRHTKRQTYATETTIPRHFIGNNNNNIRSMKIDKPQLNTEMFQVKVIHT